MDPIPVPSISDFLWLVYHPVVYVAVAMLLRGRIARFHASLWVDGALRSPRSCAPATSITTATATPTGCAATTSRSARIVSVCDAYDAMTSDRPYRRALDHDEALA